MIKQKQKQQFIYFLLFLNSFILIQCSTILSVLEYQCIENIIIKFNLTSSFNFDQSSGIYDICSNSNVVCTNNKITSLSIGTQFNKWHENVFLSENDLSCLIYTNSLTLNFFPIESNLIYYKLPNCNYINYNLVTGFSGSISRILPEYSDFKLKIQPTSISTILKFDYLINIENVILDIGPILIDQIDTIPIDSIIKTKTIEIRLIGYIDFSNNKFLKNLFKVFFKFDNSFDKSTIKYFSTISNELVYIYHIGNYEIPFYANENKLIKTLIMLGTFEKPLVPIDLTFSKYDNLAIENSGLNFNIDGKLPLIVNSNTTLSFNYGNITKFPSLENYGFNQNHGLSITNSAIDDKLPSFNGNGSYYSFDNNKIYGEIDNSWCFTRASFRNNLLTGTIPSCFTCYFNFEIVYYWFQGNQFLNYNKGLDCTTFFPRVDIISLDVIKIYGNDIGFYEDWKFNSTFTIKSFDSKIGKEYYSKVPNSLLGVDYFSILFITPNNQIYTFPVIQKSPKISSLILINNDLVINGTYFPTYLNYINQAITINDIECISYYSNFYSTRCKLLSVLPISEIYELSITLDNLLTTQVYFENLEIINDKLCKEDCKENDGNSKCNLSTGECIYSICNENSYDCSTIKNQSKIYINSIEPSLESGGISTFYGEFEENYTNLTLLIGGINCPIILISSNIIKCNATSGIGKMNVTIIQNEIILFIGRDIYNYKALKQRCPNQCSNQGICNELNGLCNCYKGYISFDCSIIKNENQDHNNNNTKITFSNDIGGSKIINQEIQFQIYFKSLIEIDFNGNTIKEYNLQNNWQQQQQQAELTNSKYQFKQTIQNKGCTILSTIEEIKELNGKQFEFAGESFKLEFGSLKFSLLISNYSYENNLNTLQISFLSSVDQLSNNNNNNQDNNQCNLKSTEININNINDQSTFNFIKISKNNKILEGRFISKLESDGRPTFLNSKVVKESNNIIMYLNLPHCGKDSCLIDPDFSVLLDSNYNSNCNNNILNSNKRSKWVIPVAVVVSVVGVSLIVAGSYIFYKKKFVEGKLAQRLKQIKMNKF